MNRTGILCHLRSKGLHWRSLCLAIGLSCSLSTSLRTHGTIVAWGNNNNGQTTVPGDLTNVTALAAGLLHSLALRPNGTVAAWGDNFFGQLNVPPGLSDVASIAAGGVRSLAIRSNGTLVAWGEPSAVPPGLTNLMAVAAGWEHNLALTREGRVIGWGSVSNIPPGLSNIIAIAAGDGHSLALRADGRVFAWGSNNFGQATVPPGLTNVAAIAAGKDHSVALRRNGTVVTWGANYDGQTNVPAGLTNIAAIAAGAYHTVALRANGTLTAWGSSVFNQTVVPPWSGFQKIAAGGYHNLAHLVNNAPAITVQPSSQRVMVTESAVLQVLAVGAPPLSFQWRRDGTNIAGATNTTLVFPNLQLGDAGTYTVTVGNPFGSVTSVEAVLTPLLAPPYIVVAPTDQTTICGEDATFSVLADGSAPLGYEWYFEDTPIEGATNGTLNLPGVLTNQAGGYHVVITNDHGAVTSSVVTLTVIANPPVITSPLEVAAEQGQFFSYTITGEQNPTDFSAADLPAGLTINPTTGVISGIPQPCGVFPVTITTANACAAYTDVLTITIGTSVPTITSPLSASGKQGDFFTYTITGQFNPYLFAANWLPLGLELDPATGIISGIPWQSGTFTPMITAANACASDTQPLALTFSPSVPAITSPLTATGTEEQNFTYQITATESPTGFGAQGLPVGLTLDPLTGLISGQSVYAGDFDVIIQASNAWGTGSAIVRFSFANELITGLSIANVSFTYSAPYLLDFEFSLRDNEDPALGDAVVVAPHLLTVVAKEDEQTISPSETAVIIQRGSAKQLKANLVLDFTQSLASLEHGDSNEDGISDAIEAMVSGAQSFVNQQSPDAQIGVFEFHRDDADPQQVVPLTTDKALLNEAIAGIWTNYVQWFPSSSRAWDALNLAITDLGASNRDEQHYVIFLSDGRDESSLATVDDVITAATNNGVKIYGIGFGNEIQTANLTAITSQTQGRYYEATNAVDLAAKFAQISKDLNGQYILRWATLKRSANAFTPSFEINYQGFTALSPTNPVSTDFDNPIVDTNTVPFTTNYPLITNIVIGLYVPADYAGSVTLGSLRLTPDAAVQPTAMTLRAAYIPRFIRQLRINYRANWPCTTTLMSTNSGEILHGWSLTETNDGAGGTWLELTSPNPQSLTTSLPYGSLGNLVHFNFRDVVSASNSFSRFDVDNAIYQTTGGQRFVVENTNTFLTVYPTLPFGTPVPWLIANGITNNFVDAEVADPDGDGVPTWQEYLANTNPRNPASVLAVRELDFDLYGRGLITFSTAPLRRYRVETSTDLLFWEMVRDQIPGTGGEITVLDERYQPWVTQTFYRVVAY